MKKLAINGADPIGRVNVPKWPVFDRTEIDMVTEVVNSGNWGIGGTKTGEFEAKFGLFCNVKRCITAVNGTLTLRLALEALGVGPDDEVILPALTFQATAASVLDVNAVPVLVDIDPDTFTIDPITLEAAITSRTKCIIPVHLYGRMADMDTIMGIAKKHDLYVLEDCAHQPGSIGNIGSFSLQSYKTLNAGEGGVLTTNDEKLGDLLCSLRNIGSPLYSGAPAMQSGNYRMTQFQAAILIAQLTRLDDQIKLREENVLYMEDKIRSIDGIKVLTRHDKIDRQAYFRWMLKYIPEEWDDVPLERFLDALRAELDNSADCNRPYVPLNCSPLYRPYSKKTHKLNDDYLKAIDPSRFNVPNCKRVYEKEAFGFFHPVLLTDKAGCDTIVNALIKLRENMDELYSNK